MSQLASATVIGGTTSDGGGDLVGVWNSAQKWADAINAWSIWLAASGASPGTVRLRRWYLRGLAETYLPRSPWKLTTDDLAGYLSEHRWGPEALKQGRSSLRSFYRWATETGKTKHNPATALGAVRVPPTLPRPAPDAALAGALQAADDRTRLMLMLSAYAGLRAGEIAGLNRTEVQLAIAAGTLVVRGKGGRQRPIPLHPRLAAELAAELALRDMRMIGTGYRYKAGLDRWLFPGSRGGPITPNAVTRVLSRALGDYTAHQLRHRFASQAYDHTRDLRAVQELLGHSQISTTAVYTALPDGALLAAVESVGLIERRETK